MYKLVLCILLLLQTYSLAGQEDNSIQPDSVIIYRLPPYRHYLVGVNCDRLKKMPDLSIKRITNQNKIRKAYKKLNDLSVLVADTSFKTIDSRVLIVFKHKDIILREVCGTAMTNMMQVDGRVYRIDSYLEHYLFQE